MTAPPPEHARRSEISPALVTGRGAPSRLCVQDVDSSRVPSSSLVSDKPGSGASPLRPFGVLSILGLVVGALACVAAIVVYERNHSGIALWLAFCFGVGTILTAGLMLWGRSMASRAPAAGSDPSGELTGRTIPVRDTRYWSASPSPEGGWRWTGGASVPHWMGRLNASAGLAVLDLGPSELTLRVRGGRLFGTSPMAVSPSSEVLCFPVRGWLGRRGVAVEPPGQRPWYFWTGAISEILSTLAWAGFRVDWRERKPLWW
jgi:hypothetical protein